MAWLHGKLEINIYEGKDLPGERMGALGGNAVTRLVEKGVAKVFAAEAYVTLDIVTKYQLSKSRFRTHIERSHNPKWEAKAAIDVADYVKTLQFKVKDNDVVGADAIGQFEIPVEEVLGGQAVEGWFPLLTSKGQPLPKDAQVRVGLRYWAAEKDPEDYSLGCGPDKAVPQVFFPLRQGNRVQLYHDAHQINAGPNDKIPLANGTLYNDGSCWNDLYSDLQAAKHFIYVAGWSVVDNVHLVRDYTKGDQEGPTIGELLKQKADDQDVKVCMLIWDDQSSNAVMAGVMGTKDEETKKYFKGSHVDCVLCPRLTGKGESLVRSMATTTMFTHHQKLVVMDAPPAPGGTERRVIAYVGGLDLTTGRYDTPDHPLFSTLHTVNKQDFYQGCLVGVDQSKGGPRQPWHDIHSRLEGPIAWDVLENFAQRWHTQASGIKNITKRMLDLKKAHDLHIADNVHHKHGDPAVMTLQPSDPESWNVQLFRSIDSNSVGDAFPKDNHEAMALGLQTGKGTTVEASIQRAYVYAIRRAERYIFIENQYFLGSAQNWPCDEHPVGGADHLVAIEIALKCAAKARAGEPFCAYAIIPLFPEGDPHSGSVQEILCWQRHTMHMMYALIGDAIREAGTDAVPQDYLQFFFVGKREPLSPGEVESTAAPDSAQGKAQKSRRHMIYVHSKMIIVDDEYIILGSANINQRSMHGSRDTEIAIGAYQPQYTRYAAQGLPLGQVHGFRTVLWEEHMGVVDEVFADPSSRACARAVARIARANLDAYLAEEVQALPSGHLCTYPVAIREDGSLDNLPGLVNFPDTNASILGKNGALPDVLTV